MYEKLTKCPNFTWLLPEKLPKYRNFYDICQKNNKIPEFHMIFARKMPEFYIIIARKIFSRILGGHIAPSAPVSYAYWHDGVHKYWWNNRYTELNPYRNYDKN